MKILFVEPDKDIREVFKLFFEIECNQQCDFVKTFKEGLALLLKNRYDIVFFDCISNDNSYKSLLDFIGNTQSPNKPIIIVTTTNTACFNLHNEVSINYVFVKPFTETDLQKMVDIVHEVKNRKFLLLWRSFCIITLHKRRITGSDNSGVYMTLPVKLNEVQSEAVKSLSKNATADTILFFFTTRKRLSRVTDLDLLKKDIEKEGFKLNIQDYKAFFGNMESQGFGIMKHPRDSSDMGSFYWDYSLRTVGKVVYPSDNEQEKNKIARILKSREVLGSSPPVKAEVTAPIEEVASIEAPKRRGRPAGSKNKPKQAVTKGKGRGRPKGSKNKPKQATIILPGVSQSTAKGLQQALVAMLKSA